MIITRLKYYLFRLKNWIYIKVHELLYIFYKNQFNSPKTHWQYSVTSKQIYGENRSHGVSGYYRLFNEEDFLEASVESHLPFFDELILVHDSTTTDSTPEIAKALTKKYPDKVKYFFYEPVVAKPRSKAYLMLPSNHPQSFINYYNYAVSKTTKQVVSKVDGDHIAIKQRFTQITENFHNLDFMDGLFYTLGGINLWSYNHELYVDPRRIVGLFDHGFYVLSPEKHYYTKAYRYENGSFSRKNRKIKNAGILYFHLKNMRRNILYQSYRGVGDKIHQKNFKQRLIEVQKHLVDWSTFVHQYRDVLLKKTLTDIAELPDPNFYLRNLMKNIPTITSQQFDQL